MGGWLLFHILSIAGCCVCLYYQRADEYTYVYPIYLFSCLTYDLVERNPVLQPQPQAVLFPTTFLEWKSLPDPGQRHNDKVWQSRRSLVVDGSNAKKKSQSGVRRPHRQLWMCKCEPQTSTQKSIKVFKWWDFNDIFLDLYRYTVLYLTEMIQNLTEPFVSDGWLNLVRFLKNRWFRKWSQAESTSEPTPEPEPQSPKPETEAAVSGGSREANFDAAPTLGTWKTHTILILMVKHRWVSKRMIFVMPNFQACVFWFSTQLYSWVYIFIDTFICNMFYFFCYVMYWSCISHRSL